MPARKKAVLRGELLALLAASLAEPTPPTDPALTPKEASENIGRSVDWLRRYGPEWHEKLVAEFGVGFIMQPVPNGNVTYSLKRLGVAEGVLAGEASRENVARRLDGGTAGRREWCASPMPRGPSEAGKGRESGPDETVKTTVRIPLALWRKAKIRCVDERREFQSIIIEALDAYLRTTKGGSR